MAAPFAGCFLLGRKTTLRERRRRCYLRAFTGSVTHTNPRRATNYYRFSGYAREFQVDPRYGDNRFVAGTGLDDIRDIVLVDAEMRSLLMKQIAVVEVALRSMVAHEYAKAYGDSAFYLSLDFYKQGSGQQEDKPLAIVNGFLNDLERDKSRMVSRYINSSVEGNDFDSRIRRYEGVPIWVAVEVASFGRISNMITYAMDSAPAKAAASTFSLQWSPFAEVVHSISVLRNLCAHHRQLWNRRMGILCPLQKKLKPRNVKFDSTSAYCQLIMLNHYRSKIDGDKSAAAIIEGLMSENPAYSEGFRLPNPK